MGSAIKIVFFIIIASIIGISIFIANWDIPAPISNIEKVIPNARFFE